MADHRRSLLAGLSGEVIEVGAGTGANFPHYPAAVTRVVAVEPEPHLRRLARRNAVRAPVVVEVVDGIAERLDTEAASFDAAVVSLVLCSVADLPAAAAELYRVVRPGGELRFLEHVRSHSAGLRRLQRALDATVWPLLVGGCHTGRDTVAALERAGFWIDRLDRFRFPDRGVVVPTSPHVAGVAIRPGPSDRA